MRRLLFFFAACVMGLPGARVFAADVAKSYVLTAWSTQTGLPPGDVLSFTEDLQGYLWLGTTDGLVRFDGAAFVPWITRMPALPADRPVPALVGARDGSLWLGYGVDGGVARIQNGTLTHYPTGDGLFPGAVTALIEDRQGTIWVGGRGGLSRFHDNRWERIDARHGYPGADVLSIYEDRDGRVWFGTSAGIYTGSGDTLSLRDGAATFVQNFAEDLQGNLWITDTRATVKPLSNVAAPALGPSVRVPQSGWRMARDRDGRLWIAALGGGLLRLEAPGTPAAVITRFPYEHKIGGSPRSVFYDREGNVWIGLRAGGLLRVAETSIASDTPLDGLTNDGVRAMTSGADGSIWIATGHSLNHFTGNTREVLPVAQTHALHTTGDGTLLVSTAREFGRVERGRFVPVPLPAGTDPQIRWENVMALSSDATGAVWLCTIDQGVVIWRGPSIEHLKGPAVDRRSCSALYADGRGHQWIGFAGGGIAVAGAGGVERHDESSGLTGGGVLAIRGDRHGGVWVITRSGLSRYQNGRFTTLTQANGPFSNLLASFLEDDEGYLWVTVNAGTAVVRFSPREVDQVAVDPRHRIEYTLYDASDGLQGDVHWQQSRGLGARAADGRLWFATGTGVSVIDPRNLPMNVRAAAPRVEQVYDDGRELPLAAAGQMPPAISSLAISWTSVSLSDASKLAFRYRLEGRDADWTFAGPRRTAAFAKLAPGRYRLRVSATNDGTWTEAALFDFAVAPPFYRTSGFIAANGLVIVGLLAAAWQIRLRAVRHQHALVIAERALVSREIHDTLLQNLAAIGMELESIGHELHPTDGGGRDAVRRLQRQVGHSLREARDLVVALRKNGTFKSRGLADAVRELADSATARRGAHVSVHVNGREERCPPDVELQLLRICQEAMNNALRHGRAGDIQIAIDMEPDAVSLTVTDNGSGFAIDDAGAARGAGGEHLGLLGMHERAERVGGRLTITSAPGAGTVVSAVVPLEAQ